jgi:DNA-binding CsgD family transcriptional regulator
LPNIFEANLFEANLLAEIILTALRFASLWSLFYLLHRPQTLLRRILAIFIMVLQFPIGRILFFSSGGSIASSIAGDTILFLILAFICEGEPSEDDKARHGDLIRPLITALYLNGMIQLINYILFCYMYAFNGTLPASFSLWSYFWKTIEGTTVLLWAFFYYRVMRNMTAKAPISFSLLAIFTPIIALVVIIASTRATGAILDTGTNFFLYGGLFGTLIIVLNMCVFYFYVKLSVAHEALVFAANLAHTPPVWTPKQGLSTAFIEKYEITPREREVVEAMLHGKTDKEISISLNIAVSTVQVHLKRIYRKTGAAGRFALSALVRVTDKNR